MDDALCFWPPEYVCVCLYDDFPTCFDSKVNVSGVVVESENACGLGVLALCLRRVFFFF